MRVIKKYIDFINEDKYLFGDIFPKNKWVKLNDHERRDLKDNLFYIIDKAYGPLGGHVRIKDSDAISNERDLTFWRAIDVNGDLKIDAVLFGKYTEHGFKISGWGHDGSTEAKKELMSKLAKLLKTPKFYIEVSGKPARILLKNYNVSYVDSGEKVCKLFPNSNIEWIGGNPIDPELEKFKGFYKRMLGDGTDTEIEIVLGNPIIK